MDFVKNCKTIRPLLSVSRFETGKLCSYWQLPIYPDKSNQKTKFLRNRIRKQIVPIIKLFFNSKIENVLFQLSEIVEMENRYLDQVANDLFSSSLNPFHRFGNCKSPMEQNCLTFPDGSAGTLSSWQKNQTSRIHAYLATNESQHWSNAYKNYHHCILYSHLFFQEHKRPRKVQASIVSPGSAYPTVAKLSCTSYEVKLCYAKQASLFVDFQAMCCSRNSDLYPAHIQNLCKGNIPIVEPACLLSIPFVPIFLPKGYGKANRRVGKGTDGINTGLLTLPLVQRGSEKLYFVGSTGTTDSTPVAEMTQATRNDMFSFIKNTVGEKRLSSNSILSKKKGKGKAISKRVVFRSENGKTKGFLETARYSRILSTSNLLERGIRRILDGTVFNRLTKPTSDGSFVLPVLPKVSCLHSRAKVSQVVKRLYALGSTNENRNQTVESLVFPRSSMPLKASFWLWNKRFYATKTLKEKTKNFFLCKKHADDCRKKEREFFLDAKTNLRTFLALTSTSTRQSLLKKKRVTSFSHLLLSKMVRECVECAPCRIRNKRKFTSNPAGKIECVLLGTAYFSHTRKHSSLSFGSREVGHGFALLSKKNFGLNKNTFVFPSAKSLFKNRENATWINVARNPSNTVFVYKERERTGGKASGKEKNLKKTTSSSKLKKWGVKKHCIVPLNKKSISAISREKHFDFFLLFQFFMYFDALKSEKKGVYWPLILSFLPTAFQRRVGRLFLLNQSWKEINYTQIEQFLALKKTCKKKTQKQR